jgi:hypothetical protein
MLRILVDDDRVCDGDRVDDVVNVGLEMEPTFVVIFDVKELPRFRRFLVEDVNDAIFFSYIVVPLGTPRINPKSCLQFQKATLFNKCK